ncbi:uncharacterized protein [Montipora foliosa]|uniref:uncharacterized protein n=1 Tax=Montipora foliosa TaxID=591990 RepID=UPI0035F15F90
MKRGSLRRNAFASGESSEPSHDLDEVFGMPSTAESVDLEADEDNRPCTQLTHEQITAFREVFDLFDSNGGGTIDAEELDLALKSVDIHVPQEDLQGVLSAMDKDGNGEIDFQEFLNLMTNAERFLESLSYDGERRKQEHLLFEALTQFMKRSALQSLNEIVGFYHTKYKRIQAPHVVGHYAAGARLIGLTENQLRRHMESLKARHAAGDNKSPYAEPLHIVFGKVARKKRPQTSVKTKVISSRKAASSLPGLSHTRGKIRLKFGIQRGPTSSSLTMLTSKTAVIPDKEAISPVGRMLIPRTPDRRDRPRPPLKKNGWVSQRFKPFPVELPTVNVKREKKGDKPEKSRSLTFDDLPKIRDKVAQAREVHFRRLRETKSKDSEEHWKSLGPNHIDSGVLRNYFRLAFNAYTPYVTIDVA